MNIATRYARTPGLRALLILASLLIGSSIAQAQNSTATVRGKVNADNAPGSTVTAKEINTGFTATAKVGADGNYVLAGLRPGSYEIVATAGGKEIASSVVTAQIGQSLTADLAGEGKPDASNTTTLEGVTVTGPTLAEADLRNSEVAKNVTQEQIRSLPQDSRNFLNFAALTPGVTVPRKKDDKGFSAFGLEANQTNVFIDGANLKNNILQGGLAGQDGSKGNPFSQEAVQEFRVITQNPKAEYEQAGSAIITAITKSGSNEFHGSIFDSLQTKGMVDDEYFAAKNGDPKPDYRRQQYGASLGGPIIQDTLQFFVSFEGNKQTDNTTVNINNATYGDQFAQYNGAFSLPFNEKVFFGKLSWQPNSDNNLDLSVSRRKDTEIVGFGGNIVQQSAQSRDNTVDDTLLKWQFRGNGFVNDVLLDSSYYAYNPRPLNPDLPSTRYFDGTTNLIAQIGGAPQTQNKQQRVRTFRDDLTLDSFSWHGDHVIKFGVKAAHVKEQVLENDSAIPQYSYDLTGGASGSVDIPFQASYSPTGKFAELANNQYGLYVQDDWDITSRLQLNLGVRWDYETNAYNKSYVTPLAQYDIINYLGLGSDYISTGKERDGYKKEFQPRFGFSYDASRDNDQSTTIFGGAGRYFDRTPLDNSIQEAFHSQYPYYTFQFSNDGRKGTIPFDPRYLTVEGLQSLIATNQGTGEIDLINNKTKPPHTDQFSLGVKQVLGDWAGSLTLSRVLSYNQFTWVGNRKVAPGFVLNDPPDSPYGAVLHNEYRKFQASSVLIGIDKPYTKESNWGVGIAYTYIDGKKNGGDAYSLDYVDPTGYPFDGTAEKHHLVMNAIVGLPWDIKFTSLITLGSGTPYTLSQFVPNQCDYNCATLLGAGKPTKYNFILPHFWAYRSVDLSLSKDFLLGHGQTINVRGDVFNLFNFTNFDPTSYNGTIGDANFGTPGSTVGLPRSFQVSARYSF